MTPFEQVAAYAAGTLFDDEADRVERAMFTDPELGAAAAYVRAVADALGELARRGPTVPVLTPSELATLSATGQVAQGTAEQGRIVVTVGDAAMVAARLPIDLGGAARIDVELSKPGGPAYFTTREAPFDPATGEIVLVCNSHLARRVSPICVTVIDEARRTRGSFILEILDP